MLPEQNGKILEKALEKAAKIICTLKHGYCPMQEPDFKGCPCVCHEDVLPWQCWTLHLRAQAAVA